MMKYRLDLNNYIGTTPKFSAIRSLDRYSERLNNYLYTSAKTGEHFVRLIQQIAQAVTEGNIPVVQELLRNNPSLITTTNTRDQSNLLFLAVRNGRHDLIRWLASNYPNLAIEQNDTGATPLIIAIGRGDLQAAQIIVTEVRNSLDVLTNDGFTPLHVAAFHGRRDIVNWLATSFPHLLDALNNRGETPRDAAIRGGNQGIADFLDRAREIYS